MPEVTATRTRNRMWISVVSVLLTVALAQAFYDVSTWGDWPPDFEAYWGASSRLRQGLYIYEDPDGTVKTDLKAYIYPPVFASLFAPLTWFPKPVCAAIWSALHALFAALMFWKLLEFMNRRGIAWPFAALLCGVLLTPLTQELREGQVNLPVLMMFAIGLLDLKNGKDKHAGFWLALSAQCKVLPIVVLPILLLSGRKQAAKWMAVWLLVLTMLPLVWTLPNLGPVDGVKELVYSYLDWLEFVFLKAVLTGNPAGHEQFYFFNNSGHAVLHRWFGDVALTPWLEGERRGPLLFALPVPLLKIVGYAVPLAMYGVACLAAWKRKGFAVPLMLGFLAAQFLNILFWEHHLLSLALLAGAMVAADVPLRRVTLILSPFMVCLTLPFLLQFVLLPTGWEWPRKLLEYSRVWGLPTFALLFTWGAAFMHTWRAKGRRDEPQGTAAEVDSEVVEEE